MRFKLHQISCRIFLEQQGTPSNKSAGAGEISRSSFFVFKLIRLQWRFRMPSTPFRPSLPNPDKRVAGIDREGGRNSEQIVSS
jgi:hypothetical protein